MCFVGHYRHLFLGKIKTTLKVLTLIVMKILFQYFVQLGNLVWDFLELIGCRPNTLIVQKPLLSNYIEFLYSK